MFPRSANNRAICFSDAGSRTDYVVLAVDGIADLHFGSSIDAYQQVPLWSYDEDGRRIDNLTDWALKQFKDHYKSAPPSQPSPAGGGRSKGGKSAITKPAIFHYAYAVLHDPVYREKYAQNLKREFPRIPLYGSDAATFWRWAGWGERLMALHIGYESVETWPLARTDIPDEKARAAGQSPKALLKADTDNGRSALEWILDQHKESNSPTKSSVSSPTRIPAWN